MGPTSIRTVRDPIGHVLEAKDQVMFTFDRVFGEATPSSELYHQFIDPLVEGVVDGYNSTCFVYGQTASGKTHTMSGSEDDVGLIPTAVSAMFDRVSRSSRQFLVRVSYVELYNEVVKDLLGEGKVGLEVRNHPKTGWFVEGATEVVVGSADAVAELLKGGMEARTTAQTSQNDNSSRSHALFRMIVESTEAGQGVGSTPPPVPCSAELRAVNSSSSQASSSDGAEPVLMGSLCLVDLAGSENLSIAADAQLDETIMKESIHINTSLHVLSRVIHDLAEGKPHVPFRESVLTRLLQNSLGGNSKTVVVACVTPAAKAVRETIRTLRFASSAKKIKNKPVVNTGADDVTMLRRYKREVAQLRKELEAVNAERERLDREYTEKLASGGSVDDLQARANRAELENDEMRQKLEKERELREFQEYKVQQMQKMLLGATTSAVPRWAQGGGRFVPPVTTKAESSPDLFAARRASLMGRWALTPSRPRKSEWVPGGSGPPPLDILSQSTPVITRASSFPIPPPSPSNLTRLPNVGGLAVDIPPSPRFSGLSASGAANEPSPIVPSARSTPSGQLMDAFNLAGKGDDELARLRARCAALETENEALKARVKDLETDLGACRAENTHVSMRCSALEAQLRSAGNASFEEDEAEKKAMAQLQDAISKISEIASALTSQ